MSDAATRFDEPSPVELFKPEPVSVKIGFVAALSFLALLDGVNGAMTSSIREYLNGTFSATADQITWGTILFYVSKLWALLMAARLQQDIGQRRAVLGTSVILVLSTIGGAFITNYPSLLISLVIQGGAGGFMLAFGQGVLLMVFPRKDQAFVQAFFAMADVMFPAVAVQAYVGAFAYQLDWQYAYLCIAPFGLLGLGWLLFHQRLLHDRKQPLPVSFLKIGLLLTALVAIVYVLQQGNRDRWLEYPPIVWSLLLAAVCLLGFAFAETDGRPTFLAYHAFGYANFTFGVTVAVLAGVVFLGGGSVISGFTTGVLNYPVLHTGLVQLTASGFATIALLVAAFALRFLKVPGLVVIYSGQILFIIGMLNLGLVPSNSDFGGVERWLILRGTALGFQFLPLTLGTLTCLPPKDDVAAAGLFLFNRQFGALIGTAWLETLHEHLTDRNQTIFGNAFSAISPNAVNYAQQAQHALLFYGFDTQAPQAATVLTLQEASRQWASIAANGCFESVAMLLVFAFPFVGLTMFLTKRYLKPPVC